MLFEEIHDAASHVHAVWRALPLSCGMFLFLTTAAAVSANATINQPNQSPHLVYKGRCETTNVWPVITARSLMPLCATMRPYGSTINDTPLVVPKPTVTRFSTARKTPSA